MASFLRRLRNGRCLRLLSGLLRQLVLAVLLTTFLWQAWTSWRKYQQGGTVNLSKHLHPDTQAFPVATVCLQNYGNITKEQGEPPGGQWVNGSREAQPWLWAYSFPSSNETENRLILFNSTEKLSSTPWSRSYPSEFAIMAWAENTQCYKFHLGQLLRLGMFNQVTFHLNAVAEGGGDFVSVNLHHPDWDIPGGFFGSDENVMHELKVETEKPHYSMYSIETKRMIKLSTKEAPCIEEENYKEDKKYHGTMLECMEREFAEREGCYMPWQTGSAKTKVCDIVKYDAFVGELRSTPTVEKFVELTGCLHSCESIDYSTRRSQSGVHEWTNLDYSLLLIFYLSSVTEEREVLAFDGLDLVGNVGGYLGLLLGFSAMSVCGFILKKVEGRHYQDYGSQVLRA